MGWPQQRPASPVWEAGQSVGDQGPKPAPPRSREQASRGCPRVSPCFRQPLSRWIFLLDLAWPVQRPVQVRQKNLRCQFSPSGIQQYNYVNHICHLKLSKLCYLKKKLNCVLSQKELSISSAKNSIMLQTFVGFDELDLDKVY